MEPVNIHKRVSRQPIHAVCTTYSLYLLTVLSLVWV